MTHAETITHCCKYYDRTANITGLRMSDAQKAVEFGLKSGLIQLPYRMQRIQKPNTKEAK